MLSRVADSVFWMNRQIERAENVARAIETTLGLALEGTIEPGRLWNALVCAFGDQSDFWDRHGLADQARVFDFLAFDPANPNSIYCCLQAARENARTVRDMISSPMWEEINKCYLDVRGASAARAATRSAACTPATKSGSGPASRPTKRRSPARASASSCLVPG